MDCETNRTVEPAREDNGVNFSGKYGFGARNKILKIQKISQNMRSQNPFSEDKMIQNRA